MLNIVEDKMSRLSLRVRLLKIFFILFFLLLYSTSSFSQGISIFGDNWGTFGNADFKGDILIQTKSKGIVYGIKATSRPVMRWHKGTESFDLSSCSEGAIQGIFDITIKYNLFLSLVHLNEKYASENLNPNSTSYKIVPNYAKAKYLADEFNGEMETYSFWNPVDKLTAIKAFSVSPIKYKDGTELAFLEIISKGNGLLFKWSDQTENKRSVSVVFPVWNAIIQSYLKPYIDCFEAR